MSTGVFTSGNDFDGLKLGALSRRALRMWAAVSVAISTPTVVDPAMPIVLNAVARDCPCKPLFQFVPRAEMIAAWTMHPASRTRGRRDIVLASCLSPPMGCTALRHAIDSGSSSLSDQKTSWRAGLR